jgi:hypothetical protein
MVAFLPTLKLSFQAITFNLIITVGVRQEERFRVSSLDKANSGGPPTINREVFLAADNPSVHSRSHIVRSESQVNNFNGG